MPYGKVRWNHPYRTWYLLNQDLSNTPGATALRIYKKVLRALTPYTGTKVNTKQDIEVKLTRYESEYLDKKFGRWY